MLSQWEGTPHSNDTHWANKITCDLNLDRNFNKMHAFCNNIIILLLSSLWDMAPKGLLLCTFDCIVILNCNKPVPS